MAYLVLTSFTGGRTLSYGDNCLIQAKTTLVRLKCAKTSMSFPMHWLRTNLSQTLHRQAKQVSTFLSFSYCPGTYTSDGCSHNCLPITICLQKGHRSIGRHCTQDMCSLSERPVRGWYAVFSNSGEQASADHFMSPGGDGPKLIELLQMREKYLLQDRIELLGPVRHKDVLSVSFSNF